MPSVTALTFSRFSAVVGTSVRCSKRTETASPPPASRAMPPLSPTGMYVHALGCLMENPSASLV